jgi:large subunit ribosomal protein L30
MLAVIRVRGSVKTDKRVVDTLNMLRLNRTNHCVLVSENQTSLGMLNKAKNWITWGQIDDKTLEKLIFKRGRLEGNKRVDQKDAKEIAKKITKNKSLKGLKIKPIFRLSPPSKGHKSVKLSYPRGALGSREEKINELIKRMI